MVKVVFQDLGHIDYKQAWDYQEKLFDQIIAIKRQNRREETNLETQSYLLFCEHPHVYTLGKSGDEKNLLVNEEYLKSRGATFHKINRGGDITYHGPGQIVGYPILDLENFFTDIHKYLRFLEEAVILTLADYGIESGRSDGETGVWLESGTDNARKICALGVRSSRWVTMHGFAFNVNPDLDYFGNIIPCGIVDKSVTSMEQELGKKVDIQEVRDKLKVHLATIFEMTLL
ncbi:MAG: lipoyl(octanoyl) transferase LipB [Flavobacteriales bacterium]|jgi:lipoyl(octanoyl) transferase|tara:strand:+ start:7523 stop:8215 length:693 start_codon:yes stop_codon:yes gene_type:complete